MTIPYETYIIILAKNAKNELDIYHPKHENIIFLWVLPTKKLN